MQLCPFIPLLGFCFLICQLLICDLLLVSSRVRLFGRGRKKHQRSRKRCLGVRKQIWGSLQDVSGPRKRPHCGAEKKLEVEKKTCHGRKQDGPIARVEKKSFPLGFTTMKRNQIQVNTLLIFFTHAIRRKPQKSFRSDFEAAAVFFSTSSFFSAPQRSLAKEHIFFSTTAMHYFEQSFSRP